MEPLQINSEFIEYAKKITVLIKNFFTNTVIFNFYTFNPAL